MKNKLSILGSNGYTLIEVMGSVALLGAIVTASLASFSFALRGDRMISVQNELDMDARMLIERLRRDLWLTSRDAIMLYPEGDGPYTAISFPVVRGQHGLQFNADGQVMWDATVIYHLWEGVPQQVRRTVFSPRVHMSSEDRQTQLSLVVQDGDGANAFNAANAQTRALITNLVDWELNKVGGRFDAFSPSSGDRRIALGSALLRTGLNTITFRSAGKNSGNEGAAQHLGVDFLYLTPSGLLQEAEWLTVHSSRGAVPSVQNVEDDQEWSGNSRLWFSSTQTGDEFTLSFYNDRWEERNFLSTSVRRENTHRILWPSSDGIEPNTYALKLEGGTNVWFAHEQMNTGASAESLEDPLAVRIFVRGTDIAQEGHNWLNAFDGGYIHYSGSNVWVRFAGAPAGASYTVRDVFIAESAHPGDFEGAMDVLPGTDTPLYFGANTSALIASTPVETSWAPFAIDRDKHYLIGFLLESTAGAEAVPVWRSVATNMPSSFVISNATAADVTATSWSTRGDVVSENAVYAAHRMRVGHVAEGRYLSQIIDTVRPSPDYRLVDWNAFPAGVGSVFVQLRAGNQPDLSDAPSWEFVSPAVSGFSSTAQGRYVQVRVVMRPEVATDGETETPIMKDYTVTWEDEIRYAEISGRFSTGPNHGVYEVEINGAKLLQGVTVDLTVYKEMSAGSRITSSAYAEIAPRNSGVTQ